MRQHQIPTESVRVIDVLVSPVTTVRDIDMLTSPWGPMSPTASERVSRHYARATMWDNVSLTHLHNLSEHHRCAWHYQEFTYRNLQHSNRTTGACSQFKVAVLVYKTLQGLTPRYLGPLTRVADLPGRRSLRSASANRLDVPFVRLSTVGGRAFSVAGPRVWNSLPDHVTSAETLIAFRHRLKTFLF